MHNIINNIIYKKIIILFTKTSMKFAEISVIKNLESRSIFDKFKNFVFDSDEYSINENDTVIILFDDNTIFDVKNDCINKNDTFTFQDNMYIDYINRPLWFDKNNNSFTFFKKTPKLSKGVYTIKYNKQMNDYIEQKNMKNTSSYFNFIYENINLNTDVFSITKLESNKDKPRYLLGYDDKSFDKLDIIFLINNFFYGFNTQN